MELVHNYGEHFHALHYHQVNVFDVQKKRIYNALLTSSSKEVINFNNVLNKIINEKI